MQPGSDHGSLNLRRPVYAKLKNAIDRTGPHVRVWDIDMAKHARARRKRLIVAEEAGAVVGFARYGPPDRVKPVGLLYLLYVDPGAWSTGAGRALTDFAVADMTAMGLTSATLSVLEDNHRARRFYEAGGWTAQDETEEADYGGAPLVSRVYAKALP
jgi:ribosomal protein S18 acetylase RimI-like enzyme